MSKDSSRTFLLVLIVLVVFPVFMTTFGYLSTFTFQLLVELIQPTGITAIVLGVALLASFIVLGLGAPIWICRKMWRKSKELFEDGE